VTRGVQMAVGWVPICAILSIIPSIIPSEGVLWELDGIRK